MFLVFEALAIINRESPVTTYHGYAWVPTDVDQLLLIFKLNKFLTDPCWKSNSIPHIRIRARVKSYTKKDGKLITTFLS